MKEWQTMRVEYSEVSRGFFSGKVGPKIRILKSDGDYAEYEFEQARLKLQNIGMDGWELISVCPYIGHSLTPGSQTTEAEILWFKRCVERK